MRKVTQGLVVATIVGAAVWIPKEAFALGPVDLEVAAKIGGGTSTVGGGPNALGFGLGGRAGISILGFYGGVTGMYYFGESLGAAAVNTDKSRSSSLVGFEGGYNFGLAILTVRPQLGLGYYNEGYSTAGSGMLGSPSGSGSSNSLYIEPGVTGLLSFGLWIVGADANLLWVPAVNDSQVAVVVHGQVGIKL